jgi:hypothetical protein
VFSFRVAAGAALRASRLALRSAASAAAISASTSDTGRRNTVLASPAIATSVTSGLSSVTTASSAVRPTLTELEIASSIESSSSRSWTSNTEPARSPARRADQHSRRPADDPNQQTEETSVGGRRQELRFDPVLFDYLPVLLTDDGDGLFDCDLPVGVKLLEQRQGVVRLPIILEGDGDHVVSIEPVGGPPAGCELFI